MSVTLAPGFESWREEMASLPQLAGGRKGTLLFDGRNKVWLFSHAGHRYTVKQYRRLGPAKAAVYTFFRKNKARRAFYNAMLLTRRGFDTPQPIALIELKRHGLYRDLYYVSGYTDWPPIRKPLTEDKPFDRRMAADFARFVASLHQNGIIHKDLNNTNVLYHRDGQHYRFMLIDVNRMSFTPDGEAAPVADCLENLTLFANRGEMFDLFAAEYVKARGWDGKHIEDVFKAKARHDRHWQRKKRLKHFISRHHGK